MPIYEYACKSCGHTLDELQKMSDDPLVDCPACGKLELKRMISAPRFRLKGQGWYETDFKKDNQRNLAKGDTESVKPASTSDKPASTADKKDAGEKTKVDSKPKTDAKKETS